jgi:hypothetical protein
MTKVEEKIVTAPKPPADPELLPGGCNDDSIVRGILADAIKRSDQSREQIAERMSFLLATSITADMLNNFTANGKVSHRFPLAWLRAFCQSTGDWRLMRHVAEESGFLLISEADADVVTLGEQVIERERAESEIKRIANKIIDRRSK